MVGEVEKKDGSQTPSATNPPHSSESYDDPLPASLRQLIADSRPDLKAPIRLPSMKAMEVRLVSVSTLEALTSVTREVNTSRPANKSQGVGYLPMHIDFVNAQFPPEIIALACVRKDPLGGGASLLADMKNIRHELSARDVDILPETCLPSTILSRAILRARSKSWTAILPLRTLMLRY